jgi:hypothetical protein
MVNLRYAITENDYKNFVAFVLWEGSHNKKKRRNYYLRQTLPLTAFLLAFYYTGTFERSFIYIAIGILLITTLLSFTGVRSRFAKDAEAFTADPANQAVFSEKHLQISDAGITVSDEFSDTNFRWPAFIKKEENDLYYFLFIGSNHALIIPKRVITDPQEKILVEKLFSRNISLDAEFSGLIKS